MRMSLCQIPLPAGGLRPSKGILPVHGAQTALGRGLVWSSQATWTRDVEDAPEAQCCTPHGGGPHLRAGCLPLPLPRCRRCGPARGGESAASGRLGPNSTRSVKCCLAPGILRLLLGLRVPARNSAETGKPRCKTANVAPFLLSPYPLRLHSVQGTGFTSHPYRFPRAAVTNDPNLDGFHKRIYSLTYLEARSPKSR